MHNELLKLGFAPFCNNLAWCSYENKTLVAGGIRIEVVGDVASVWCPAQRHFSPALSIADALLAVQTLLASEKSQA